MKEKSMDRNFTYLMDTAFHQITELGSVTVTAIIALSLLFFNQDLAIRIIIGIISVTIVSYLIKILFFRERPKRQPKNNMIEKIDASSFPSVHSARITVIIFWLILFFTNIYFIIFSAIIGLLVIYSRVYLRKHYWIDIIGGILIALIINAIIRILVYGRML